ncbi:hypothetical protein J1605_010512 [Eschrichtius robustus]|uniref:Uncharacterized protein n=1 Tax=Eschrichtius robustus TaxID=9764 RepID=A0AB34GU88_ESCRO|nr:hypothetical protein J1605_010512 [Eschrichtius robustus]
MGVRLSLVAEEAERKERRREIGDVGHLQTLVFWWPREVKSSGPRLGRGGEHGPRPGGAVEAPETGSGTGRTARPPGVWGYRKWSLGGPWWPPRLGGPRGSCSEGGQAGVLRAFGRVPLPLGARARSAWAGPGPRKPLWATVRPSQRPPRATGVLPPLAAAAEAGPVTFFRPAQRRHVEPGYPVPRAPEAQRELAVRVQKGTALAGRRSHRRRSPSPEPKSLIGGCGAISQGLRDSGPGLAWPGLAWPGLARPVPSRSVPRAPGPGSRRGEGRTREERS